MTPNALNAIPDNGFKFSHNMEWVTAQAKVRIEDTATMFFSWLPIPRSWFAPSYMMFVTSTWAFSSFKRKHGNSEESSQ